MDDKTVEKNLDLDRSYNDTFNGKAGEAVFKDLMRHCCYEGKLFRIDQREQDHAIAARDVFCYIKDRVEGVFSEQMRKHKEDKTVTNYKDKGNAQP